MRLYRLIQESSGLTAGGLHVYDGHIHESDLAARARQCDDEYAAVEAMIDRHQEAGLPCRPWSQAGRPRSPFTRGARASS